MKKLYEKFCALEQWTALLLLAGITILVFIAALTRTCGYPINWAQDTALVMFAWMCFLGGDIAIRTTGLIGVDLFAKMFPGPVQKFLDILFKILILVFLAVLVVYGYQYVVGYARRMITTLNISYAWVTSCVPVGAALMFVNTAINLVKSIRTPAEKWAASGGPEEQRPSELQSGSEK
ncbi:MAG: TRAP transporter small permease [Fretibacterium sp.]|nr:TRAP transporter small permease [Fretibacterium sp.]